MEAVRHEPRDAAIIELLLQTGLRLSELARLKITDVELPVKITKEPGHVGAVHIYGKGRKARTVTLNWKACKAIKTYLSVRPADTDDPHLFLTKFKLGIGPRSIENVVSKYLEEVGIRGASVHSLRHTFGTHTSSGARSCGWCRRCSATPPSRPPPCTCSWPGRTWTGSCRSTLL